MCSPTRSSRTRASEERGSATVEFALVLPLLLTIVFGIITYGYMLSFRQSISLAASEGVRAAAVAPAGTADADRILAATAAIDRAVGYGVDCSSAGMTCTVTIDPACGLYGCATVRIAYDYRDNPLTPLFPGVGSVVPQTLAYETTAEVS